VHAKADHRKEKCCPSCCKTRTVEDQAEYLVGKLGHDENLLLLTTQKANQLPELIQIRQ